MFCVTHSINTNKIGVLTCMSYVKTYDDFALFLTIIVESILKLELSLVTKLYYLNYKGHFR